VYLTHGWVATEQAIRELFPERVVERAKQVAAGGPGNGSSRLGRDAPAEDMELTVLVSGFGSEDKCRLYLEQLRWPDGVRCPRCDAARGISRIRKRDQFECDACGYQFSVRVGTILHDSNLPLWKWFLAVYVMETSRQAVSANQLKRMLGVSYKTAWYLCRRIRAAMRNEQSLLGIDVA